GVVVGHRCGNHLDRAAGEPIAERPGGTRPGPVHEVVDRREDDVVVVSEDARRRRRRIGGAETRLGRHGAALDNVLFEVDRPRLGLLVDRHRIQSIEFSALCTAFASKRVRASCTPGPLAMIRGNAGSKGVSSVTRPPASRTSIAPAIQSQGFSTDSKYPPYRPAAVHDKPSPADPTRRTSPPSPITLPMTRPWPPPCAAPNPTPLPTSA